MSGHNPWNVTGSDAAGVIYTSPNYDLIEESDENRINIDIDGDNKDASVSNTNNLLDDQKAYNTSGKMEIEEDLDSKVDSLDDLYPKPEPITPERYQELREMAIKWKNLSEQLEASFYDTKYFFVLSARWLKRWKIYLSYDEATKGLPSDRRIGAGQLPAINADIIMKNYTPIQFDKDSNLEALNYGIRPNLLEHKDYELVSGDMWEILISQYAHYTLKRFMEETSDGKKVEVYFFQVSAIAIYNSVLRSVESSRMKKFDIIHFQLPKYRPLTPYFYYILSTKIKEFLAKYTRNSYSYDSYSYSAPSFTQFDPVKIWQVTDGSDNKTLLEQLYKMCRANSTYNYKIFFPGDLTNLTSKSVEELQMSPESIYIVYILQTGFDWALHNKQNLIKTKCDYCQKPETLGFMCSCGVALYCSQPCKTKGKEYHRNRCPRDGYSSEEEKELAYTESSRRGIVGLRNLGNTCFMNSGIQCITSIKLLTDYFLDGKYVSEINMDNPIGTKGELSKAYAKQVEKMWYGYESSVAPVHLKRAIGKFQPMFLGYDQHDSGYLISYLLDGLHEDLNRVKTKPYTYQKDYDGRPDEVVAKESWELFLKRNQSIIVDLMYGQYKSRLECPKCQKVSVTFDPFLLHGLPIPQDESKIFTALFITDRLKSVKLEIRYQKEKKPKLKDIKRMACEKLNSPENRVIVTGVTYYENKLLDLEADANDIRKEYKYRTVMMRQLEADENPSTDIPVSVLQTYCSSMYGYENYRKGLTKERIYYFNPSMTAKQVHYKLYSMFGQHLDKVGDYQKDIIECEAADQKWRILLVTKSSYDMCEYCKKIGCYNCPLPYSDEITVQDLLNTSKNFKDNHQLQFEIYYRKNAIDVERTYESGETTADVGSGMSTSGNPTIYDCFKLGEQPETLEEENAWYCPQCKDFVLARKEMSIYKAPRILIVYLKRFKNKGYKGMFKSKLTTVVDFPIDDLDITKFVLNHELPEAYMKEDAYEKQPSSNHYSLFAISNHFGGMGGGHYTAYCRKEGGSWHYYDDSSVSPISADRLTDSSAYVLFYRRKD